MLVIMIDTENNICGCNLRQHEEGALKALGNVEKIENKLAR